jgi:peptide chain release factor 1
MFDQLESIKSRYYEIEKELADPLIIANQDRFRELNKEYSSISEIVKAYDEYSRVKTNLAGSKEMLYSESDPEMKALAQAIRRAFRASAET